MKKNLITVKDAAQILGVEENVLLNSISPNRSLNSESMILESELQKLLLSREIKAHVRNESSCYEIELSSIQENTNEIILFLLLKKETEGKFVDNYLLEVRANKTNFSCLESFMVVKELILDSKISESCCVFIDKNQVRVSEFFKDFDFFSS